jgi:hypothetical protein
MLSRVHSRSSSILLPRVWSSFDSLFDTALLVCLLASAAKVRAQSPSWSTLQNLSPAKIS